MHKFFLNFHIFALQKRSHLSSNGNSFIILDFQVYELSMYCQYMSFLTNSILFKTLEFS